jgi:hypothetical protein
LLAFRGPGLAGAVVDPVIIAGKPRLGGAELGHKVNARIERQRLFERDNPPMY